MAWIRRLRAVLGREKLARELEEEVDFHLSMREQWNVEQGMAQAEARRDARRRFGNPVAWRERMREVDLLMWPQTVLQDLRYGARMLRNHPGFTIVAVVALAIGIGINTAAFTAYKAFLLRPLDAHDSGAMVNIALQVRSDHPAGDLQTLFSYADYQAYRDQTHALRGLIAVSFPQNLMLSVNGGTVSQGGSPPGTLMTKLGLIPGSSHGESAFTLLVSENYFSVLGTAALRGRLFSAGDAAPANASPIILISENYWQKRFAGDPEILGKSVRLNGAAFTVVGITPHNFAGTSVAVPDFWLPLSSEPLVFPDDDWLHNRETLCLHLYGRLATGTRIQQAQTEMSMIAGQLRSLHDAHSDLAKATNAVLWPGSPFPLPIKQYSGLRYAVLLIMAAVWMVLVVACANVASLQLARAASRQNELSMRLSLGASRLRIIRQLLTESALLGLLAGAAALVVSWASLRVLVVVAANAAPPSFGTFIFHVNPDPGIFAYVFGVSLVAGILFGLAPALQSSGAAVSSSVKARAGTSSFGGRRIRDLLTATQVAVSLVLMIAGAMLIRSSIRALKMDTGYDGKQIVDLDLRFPEWSRDGSEHKAALVRELRGRVAALPGVDAITSAWGPDGNGLRTAAVSINGEKPSPQNTRLVLYYSYIQPNYFQALGIPVVLGRGFAIEAGQPGLVVVLSESAAQLLWPGQNPIGRSLRLGSDGQFQGKGELLPDGPSYQVIGVARDTRGVLMDGSDAEQVYLPLPEDRLQDYPVLIRTRSDPARLIQALGSVISSVDPDLVATASTLDELLRTTPAFFASSFSAAIASTVGLLGLLLASMGIYGTVSYMVVLRRREVGIRLALGAKRRDILELLLRQGMRPVFGGLAAGLFLALGASYLLRGVIYGLKTIDTFSFAGVSVLFLVIAFAASYLPSRKALRVDPVVALRCE